MALLTRCPTCCLRPLLPSAERPYRGAHVTKFQHFPFPFLYLPQLPHPCSPHWGRAQGTHFHFKVSQESVR